MKVLNHILCVSFLFVFCQCGWIEDEECTELPNEITVGVYVQIEDDSGDNCEFSYAVDFYKEHCGGGLSSMMSYLFSGCYEDKGKTYVNKEGIGTWDITFRNNEDKFFIKVVDNLGKELGTQTFDGKRIFKETNEGASGLRLYVFLLGTEKKTTALIVFND